MNFASPEDWLKLRAESQASILSDVAKVSKGLPDVLLSYQKQPVALLSSTAYDVLVIEKSRRIGLTWGLASGAVLKAAARRTAGGMDVMYISYNQEMTRDFIDACAMWAKAFSVAAAAAEEFMFEDQDEQGEKHSIQAFRIRFASGFEIVGLSSAPRSLRGKQGLVIIDEAAFVESLSELLKAALALLMWGGKVVVCSTHNGDENPFNVLVQDVLAGRLPYKHIRIDLDDALKAGLYRRICLVKGEPWSQERETQWRDKLVASMRDAADEELFCVPAQGSGAWLSSELIERQAKQDPKLILRMAWPQDYLQWDATQQRKLLDERKRELDLILKGLNEKRRHALGFDFARVADLSVVCVDEISEVMSRDTKLVVEMRNGPHDEQREIVNHIWQRMPRKAGGAFDATGSGEYVAEAMARLYGAYDMKAEVGGMIAQVKLSVEWYRLHMPKLKAAFEDGNTTIPRDDDLAADLRSVKVVKGVAQIPALRKGVKGLKRHGDFAVAKALCYYASQMNTAEYEYRAVPQKASGPGDQFWTSPAERFEFQKEDQGEFRTIEGTMRGGI